MFTNFQRIKSFLGPYDYRPGFIYFTILIFNLSNLRTYTFDHEFGMERIKFFLIGLMTYALLGLPLYLALKISRALWDMRKKRFSLYLLEVFIASLVTLLAQISGQRYLIPLIGTENFLMGGVFIGELITRFLFALIFVAVTHNRLRALGQNLEASSTLNAQLKDRYQKLIESDEAIRSEASQLLHDRIQSKLMLAGAKLTRISGLLSEEGKLGVLPVVKELEHIRSIDVREVSQLLTPNLAGEGLIGSCENLCNQFSSDISFRILINEAIEEISIDTKLGLYRIIEQGVINSIKHGPAASVSIQLEKSAAGDLKLEVQDDGPGSSSSHSGKGTVVIDSWVSKLGGRKEIETHVGHGFTLRVFIP